MPFFHYVANDKKGARVEGTIQASNTEDATRLLAERGFKVTSIVVPPRGAQAQTQVPKQAQFRTKRGSDRQRFFLFAQIAQQLKAGISPADAFPTLAAQLSHKGFSESLRRIAAATAEGAQMSQIMAMYPDLYPDHAVGLVRAGEMGGFVPDACAAVSEQAGSAHKFRIWHWFLWAAAISTVITIASVTVVMTGISTAFQKIWTTGVSPKDGPAAVWQCIKEACVGPTGVTAFSILAALGIGLWLLNRPAAKRTRHLLGLKYPIYGKRAVSEGVTIFSWVLGLLSRSGVPPNTAWSVAAQCAPNMVLRDRLAEAGRRMNTNSRVSEAVFGSKLFSEEYAPVISTGEMTGDLPGSLERLAQVSRGDFDSQTQYAKLRSGCWGCLLLVVTGFGGMTIIYYFYTKILVFLMDHGAD
jgi:type II secretory pathway component PulF